MTLKAML